MRLIKGCACMLLVVLGFLSAGCDIGESEGVYFLGKTPPSTVKSRLEFEVIPNARLAWEDATPEWPLGRYGYRDGSDRVLVISNITSYEDSYTDKEGNVHTERKDHYLERAWITIPLGTLPGQSLRMEDLETNYLIGYDAGVIDSPSYLQPNTLKGRVTILDDQVSTIRMHVDIKISPKRWFLQPWRVKETVAVPMTSVGVRATKATWGIDINSLPLRRVPGQLAKLISPETQPAGESMAPTPVTPSGQDANPNAPGSGHPPATQPTPPGSTTQPAARSIEGRWIQPRSANYNWEIRFQFDVNNRFVYTTQRPTYPAIWRKGRWKIVTTDEGNQYVSLFIEDSNQPEFKNKTYSLKITWVRDRLMLDGDIGPDPYLRELRMLFDPATFQDMNVKLPPDK